MSSLPKNLTPGAGMLENKTTSVKILMQLWKSITIVVASPSVQSPLVRQSAYSDFANNQKNGNRKRLAALC